MVSEKFAKAETSVWKNVVVAYSKCNAHETSWQTNYTEVFPTEATAATLPSVEAALGTYAMRCPKDPSCSGEVPDGFVRRRGIDTVAGWNLLAQPTWTRHVGSMAFLCRVDPSCVGFSSVGMLKNKAGFDPNKDVVKAAGVDLYLLSGR